MLDQLWTAAALGVSYGLGPCTISCAPLIVPIIASNARSKWEGFVLGLVFSGGRVLAYTFLGFLSGLIGNAFNLTLDKRILGLTVIALGIAIMLKLQNRCILHTKMKFDGPIMTFVAGLLLGLGPCPPLLALLGVTMASKSALLGALMGIVFGLGTIISPLIILGFLSGWLSQQKEFKDALPYVSGGFLVLIGISYLL